MKTLICSLLFFFLSSFSFQQDYYAFAYFIGSEDTLLYTEIVTFQLTTDNPNKIKQELIKIQRNNSQRFIRFVKHRFPEAMPDQLFASETNCIFISQSLEEIKTGLNLKKSTASGSHKRVDGFPFSFPSNKGGCSRSLH